MTERMRASDVRRRRVSRMAGALVGLVVLGTIGSAAWSPPPVAPAFLTADQCPRVADPKLEGGDVAISYFLAPGTDYHVRVWVTQGAADPVRMVGVVFDGTQSGATVPLGVVWDGTDFRGRAVKPGAYDVHVAAEASGVEVIHYPVNIVRLGISEIEAQSSAGTNEWQMVYFMKGTAYSHYATPAIGEYLNRAGAGETSDLDLEDGSPRPPVPLHTATDEPVMDGSNYEQDAYNYPLCYLIGAQPQFEATMGATCTLYPGKEGGVGYPIAGLEIQCLATDDVGAWTSAGGSITPGGTTLFTGPALPTKATREDRVITWTWQCRAVGDLQWSDIPGSQQTAHRFYTIVNTPHWAPGASGTQYSGPWVETVEYLHTFANALGIDTSTEAGVVEAFIKGFFGQNGSLTTAIEGLVYDTYTMGGDGGANHYYVWSTNYIRLSKLLNDHARGIFVNCTDVASTTSTMLGMMGIQDVRMLYLGNMYLNAIWGIGCPDYTVNLWGSGSHGFSYHHIITRDDGVSVSDACMWLDEDGTPGSLPGTPGYNCDRPWAGANGYNALSASNNVTKTLDLLPTIQ